MKLNEIKLGQLQEAFDQEMNRLVENIRDEKTAPVDKRALTITLEIKPLEDREHCTVTYKVSWKEVPKLLVGSTMIKRNKDTKLLELLEAPGDKAIAGQFNVMEFGR